VLVDAVPVSAERRRGEADDGHDDPATEDPSEQEEGDPSRDPARWAAELLTGIRSWRILRLDSHTGLAASVRAALTASGTPEPDPEGSAPAPSWIWVLPDDGIPAADALEQLLSSVETAPSVGVAGGKQVSATDDQRLWEVGFTTTRRGVRVTGIERYEVDQGQHDHRCDVLAVTGAGMLVRRDVWASTGGPDPGLAGARDDLDLCRRARLAGHRVIVVPGAVISRTGCPVTPGGAIVPSAGTAVRGPWARADRYDALHLRLAWAAWPVLPLAWLWLIPSALVRAIPLTLSRQPRRAWHEFLAACTVLVMPHRWLRARMRSSYRRAGRGAMRPLLASHRDLWRQRRDVLADRFGLSTAVTARPAPRTPVTGTLTDPTATGDRRLRRRARDTVTITGDDSGMPDEPLQIRAAGPRLVAQSRRSALTAPLPVLVVTAIAGLVASWRLLGGTGTVAGPFLTPAPATGGQLWELVSHPMRSIGLGTRAVADPFDEILAVLSAPPGVAPRAVLLALLVFAPPLSALTAWIAAGQVVRIRAVRIWAALIWAAAPPLLVAIGSGRPAAALAHILLPLAALALTRAVGGLRGGRHGHTGTSHPRGSIAAAAAAGLTLTVILAAAPSLAVAVGLALLALALARPGSRRYLLIPVVAVGALLAPWWTAVVRDPRLLVVDPGQGSHLGSSDGTWWHVLLIPGGPESLFGDVGRDLSSVLGGGVGAGTIALILSVLAGVGVLLPGLIGLLRDGPGRTGALLGWTVGLTGLGTAVVAGRIAVADTADGVTVGFAGPGLSVFALGAVVAAVAGLWTAGERSRRPSGAPRSDLVAAGVAAVAAIGAVLVLAGWSWQGTDPAGPYPASGADVERHPFVVDRVDADILPSVAAAEASGPAATRTLVLRVTDSRVRWSLLHSAGPRLGQDSAAAAVTRLGQDSGDAALVVPVIGDLLSDSGQDARSGLADLGIGAVLLLDSGDEASRLALDSSPGLERVLSTDGSILWRVGLDGGSTGVTRPSFARILAADGTPLTALSLVDRTVRAYVSAGPDGRVLVLSTRADAGWTATVDGAPAAAATHAGWAQSFRLPAEGGHVILTYQDQVAQRLMLARGSVLGLVLLAAFPWPRLRRRAAVEPRPSRPVPRAQEPEDAGADGSGPRPRIFDEDYPDPDGPGPDATGAPRDEAATSGIVLEPLPPVPRDVEVGSSAEPPPPRQESPAREGTIDGTDSSDGTDSPGPEEPRDVLGGTLSTGFVDWAAVHLPEPTTPPEPDPIVQDPPRVEIDVIDVGPPTGPDVIDTETQPVDDAGVPPADDTETQPADDAGIQPADDAGAVPEPVHRSPRDDTAPAGERPGAVPVFEPTPVTDHGPRTEIALPEDDTPDTDAGVEPIPVFPGVDPEELDDFEPYRPEAGRPLRSTRKDLS
jgi:hypothetical protein